MILYGILYRKGGGGREAKLGKKFYYANMRMADKRCLIEKHLLKPPELHVLLRGTS